MAGIVVGDAHAVIAHVQQETTAAVGQLHFDGAGLGMAQCVADRFAADQEHLFHRVGLQGRRCALHGQPQRVGALAGVFGVHVGQRGGQVTAGERTIPQGVDPLAPFGEVALGQLHCRFQLGAHAVRRLR